MITEQPVTTKKERDLKKYTDCSYFLKRVTSLQLKVHHPGMKRKLD